MLVAAWIGEAIFFLTIFSYGPWHIDIHVKLPTIIDSTEVIK